MESPAELRAAILRTWFQDDNQRAIAEWNWRDCPTLNLPRYPTIVELGRLRRNDGYARPPREESMFSFILSYGDATDARGNVIGRWDTIACMGVKVVDEIEYTGGRRVDLREPDVVETSRS